MQTPLVRGRSEGSNGVGRMSSDQWAGSKRRDTEEIVLQVVGTQVDEERLQR